MTKKISICLSILILVSICLSLSHAQENTSKWDLSKRLGELAIRMAPKSYIMVSDKSAGMGEETISPTLKADTAEFESLLKQGADPFAIKIADYQPAGRQKLSSGMTFVTSGNPGRVVSAEETGVSLFHYLVYNNLYDACRILDSYGYVAAKDIDNSLSIGESVTPLHFSSEKGYIEMVKFLIAKGADVNKEKPVNYAIDVGNVEVVKLLLDKGANATEAMIHASYQGDTEFVKILLDKGADPNASEAMQMASFKNYTDIIELLLDKGAKVNAKISWGKQTSLHIAADRGYWNLVELLIKRGADVNQKDDDGKTALAIAKEGNNKSIEKMLIEAGAKE